MHAHDVLGPPRLAGDFVHVEVRRIRCQQRTRLDDPVESREHLLLQLHVLEHGLDHQVAFGERVPVRAGPKEADPFLDLVVGKPSARGAAFVVAPYRGQAAGERLAALLDDLNLQAGVGEGHRDAAAHRAGAQDADLGNLPNRRVRRNVGDLARRSFGEEVVALRP